ncbi:HAD family hydrolase [Lysobacter fragariae]
MKKPLFIFDYDGTLCDTLEAISGSLLSTFAEFSSSVPAQDDISRLIGTGKTLQETINELRSTEEGALDDDALKQWVGFYRQRYAEHGESKVTLFDGAKETLSSLREVGDLVLLSNKGIEAVEGSLKRFDIRSYFSLVLAEEPGQPKKPDPAVFANRIAPVFVGVRAEDCIVIGDTSADLEFARNIGATACFAEYGFGERSSCDAVGYQFAFSHLSQLADRYVEEHPFELVEAD